MTELRAAGRGEQGQTENCQKKGLHARAMVVASEGANKTRAAHSERGARARADILPPAGMALSAVRASAPTKSSPGWAKARTHWTGAGAPRRCGTIVAMNGGEVNGTPLI